MVNINSIKDSLTRGITSIQAGVNTEGVNVSQQQVDDIKNAISTSNFVSSNSTLQTNLTNSITQNLVATSVTVPPVTNYVKPRASSGNVAGANNDAYSEAKNAQPQSKSMAQKAGGFVKEYMWWFVGGTVVLLTWIFWPRKKKNKKR